MKYCKRCGAEMVEDAWEEIINENDSIIVNPFLAYICKNSCGYFEKINRSNDDEQVGS